MQFSYACLFVCLFVSLPSMYVCLYNCCCFASFILHLVVVAGANATAHWLRINKQRTHTDIITLKHTHTHWHNHTQAHTHRQRNICILPRPPSANASHCSLSLSLVTLSSLTPSSSLSSPSPSLSSSLPSSCLHGCRLLLKVTTPSSAAPSCLLYISSLSLCLSAVCFCRSSSVCLFLLACPFVLLLLTGSACTNCYSKFSGLGILEEFGSFGIPIRNVFWLCFLFYSLKINLTASRFWYLFMFMVTASKELVHLRSLAGARTGSFDGAFASVLFRFGVFVLAFAASIWLVGSLCLASVS